MRVKEEGREGGIEGRGAVDCNSIGGSGERGSCVRGGNCSDIVGRGCTIVLGGGCGDNYGG